MKLVQGNKYSFILEGETKEGIFINEMDNYIYIKLKSGYNIGVDKKKIKKLTLLEEKKKKEEKKQEKKERRKLPNISILHTGGTVASKVDYSTGAVIAQFSEQEILELFPEMERIANIDSKLVGNMQSEMMRFNHYNLLAEAVKEEAEKGADGIIITHGTDTMHYTAAALSFALENLGIPIILVGSQRSSDRPSTDAATNLINATTFMAKTDYSGVAICMHEGTDGDACIIIQGTKAKKFHTSRRNAFKPINTKPIAKVNYEKNKIEILSKYKKKDWKKKIKIKPFNEKLKIGLLEAHPHMYAEEFLNYKHFDGLVIELLGIGHLPTMKVDSHTKENDKILSAIKNLTRRMPVVASPQTIFGRIDMNVYSPGKQLQDAGIIGNYTDMHPETAFIKLAWLLSNYKKEEVKKLFLKNLRGEITDRTEEADYI